MTTDQTVTDQPDPTILTADEIAVLNAARAVCQRYETRLRMLPWRFQFRDGTNAYDTGWVACEAEHAADHLFSLVSAANIYLRLDLSDHQVHGSDHYAPTGRVIPADLRLVPVA